MNQLTILLTTLSFSSVTASHPAVRGAKTNGEPRRLQQVVSGECTVANFSDEMLVVGGQPTLASWLDVENVATTIQAKLDVLCAEALKPTMDLSVAVGKGPQFLKNFLDGGTTWNDNYDTADGQYSLETDAAIIDVLDASTARNVVFSTPDGGTSAHYPYYFSNFYNEDHECRLGAIECCYTASRKDATVDDNAEMCALDMSLAAQSNHIKSKSYTIFNTKSTDDTYCSGFAWEEGTFGDAVKYNTLFHMAMKENLYNKGRVKNIPGAPLCGCAEQMPIITNAACTRATEGYVIDSSGAVSVSIGWDDCDGKDLLDYYDNLPGRGDTEKFFMKSKIVGEGKCEEAIDNFMNDHMLIH